MYVLGSCGDLRTLGIPRVIGHLRPLRSLDASRAPGLSRILGSPGALGVLHHRQATWTSRGLDMSEPLESLDPSKALKFLDQCHQLDHLDHQDTCAYLDPWDSVIVLDLVLPGFVLEFAPSGAPGLLGVVGAIGVDGTPGIVGHCDLFGYLDVLKPGGLCERRGPLSKPSGSVVASKSLDIFAPIA